MNARAWRTDPVAAGLLDDAAAWRKRTSSRPLLDVLGQLDVDGWTDAQDWALAQLIGHLRAGHLRVIRVDVGHGPAGDLVEDCLALRRALGTGATAHIDVDGGAFLAIEPGYMLRARVLWTSVAQSTPAGLSLPATVPLQVGPVAASRVLYDVQASTAVARWPAGRSDLTFLASQPLGRYLPEYRSGGQLAKVEGQLPGSPAVHRGAGGW